MTDQTTPEPEQHFAAGGYKCTCGFDALAATYYRHKPGHDYVRELNSHFDWERAPAEDARKDALRKQFNGAKASIEDRSLPGVRFGFGGITFVVDEVRMSVEAFEALAAVAVRNVEDEYALNYERH
ncbi:hypothetical protein [Arthrobacter sp. UYCo732]|uniref:hypothetical protein n=1 Tax=Arthrobacter sp. UYCo732 TaxID=3156336 RepID=UPI0033983693